MAYVELGTVLVTGGSSGLGAVVVDAVRAAHGIPIVIDGFKPESKVDHEVVDLTDRKATARAINRIAGRHGGLGAIVLCAEAGRPEGPPDLTDKDAIIRAALPYLHETGGRVIAIASTLGLRAKPEATTYSATKFGVVGVTQARAAKTNSHAGGTCLIVLRAPDRERVSA